jgi:hypothetical protein
MKWYLTAFIFYCFTEKLHSSFLFISGGDVVVVSTDFDFTLLYKLIRNLLIDIPAPTNGWGILPRTVDVKEADDIERIRHLRNIINHKTKLKLTTQ